MSTEDGRRMLAPVRLREEPRNNSEYGQLPYDIVFENQSCRNNRVISDRRKSNGDGEMATGEREVHAEG